MRGWMLVAALMATAPAMAQSGIGYDQGGPYEGVFADHRATGDNGATRVNRRIGGSGAAPVSTTPVAPARQPASSGVHIYHPTPLNDLAIAEKEKAAAKRQGKAPR